MKNKEIQNYYGEMSPFEKELLKTAKQKRTKKRPYFYEDKQGLLQDERIGIKSIIYCDYEFLRWCEDTLEDENGRRREEGYWFEEFSNNHEWCWEIYRKYLKEQKEKK